MMLYTWQLIYMYYWCRIPAHWTDYMTKSYWGMLYTPLITFSYIWCHNSGRSILCLLLPSIWHNVGGFRLSSRVINLSSTIHSNQCNTLVSNNACLDRCCGFQYVYTYHKISCACTILHYVSWGICNSAYNNEPIQYQLSDHELIDRQDVLNKTRDLYYIGFVWPI